ncbi:MAG TPA: hypothetical protein VN238_03120, partial [Solirubrobacteraceae bacterium]|nr:hypothetical protein [Solirubrobacteraceae bacterium]
RATVGADGTVRTLLLAPEPARVELRAPCARAWLAGARARAPIATKPTAGGGCVLDLPRAGVAVLTGPR